MAAAHLQRVLRDVFLNGALGSYLVPRGARWRLLRFAGLPVERSGISARCFFGSRNIIIGRNTFVNYGVVFDGASTVTIGQNCQIGMQAMFLTGTHAFGNHDRRASGAVARPVVVGDGCWIGARAIVLPGVTVADGCVIGAGAVVTADTEPDGVYVGVPATRVRDFD